MHCARTNTFSVNLSEQNVISHQRLDERPLHRVMQNKALCPKKNVHWWHQILVAKKKIHLILKLRFFFKLLCEEINVKILVFSRKYQFIKFVKTHGNEKILPFCNFDERFFFKLSQCAGVGKVKKNRTHKERRGWRRLAEALPGSDRGPGCLLHKW